MDRKRWILLGLAAVCCVQLLLVPAGAATYRLGSQGETVRRIQTALQERGYDPGAADGVFGSRTETAVRRFQTDHGLTADGVVGERTLQALGLSATGGSTAVSDNELALLARIISAEARGEPYQGQVAVGAVILNRVEHPSFPNTIAGVIYQPGAFSCLYDGQADQPVADSAYRAARDAMNGSDPSGGAIYYFNPATATNSWIWSRPLITVIGKHRFCA